MSFSFSHVVLPSFHWIKILEMMIESLCSTSVPSVRWSMMELNIECWFPSSSIWENKLVAIILALSDALWASTYSTSYNQVSRIGLLDAVPIGIPFASHNLLVTLAKLGFPRLWAKLTLCQHMYPLKHLVWIHLPLGLTDCQRSSKILLWNQDPLSLSPSNH